MWIKSVVVRRMEEWKARTAYAQSRIGRRQIRKVQQTPYRAKSEFRDRSVRRIRAKVKQNDCTEESTKKQQSLPPRLHDDVLV